VAKIVIQTSNEKEQKIMWEKFKSSKFATKMRNAKSSRTVYITVVTLLLALAVLITATAIANRVKKNNGGTDLPPADGTQGGTNEGDGNNQGNGNQQPPSSEQPPADEDSGKDEGNSTQTSAIPELS
jgi:hypothetical protein